MCVSAPIEPAIVKCLANKLTMDSDKHYFQDQGAHN